MRLDPLLNRWVRFLTTVTALFLASLTPAAAQPLKVGVTPTLPPMVYKQDGRLTGLEVDLAQALGQALNRPIEFVEVKWEDQIPDLLKGRTDIIMSSMSVTRPRAFQIAFTHPYLRIGQMALVRGEDRGLYVLGFPSVISKAVGVKEGTTGDFLVQQNWAKAKRRYYGTGEDAAKALIKKRIDLFIADGTLIWWLAGTYAAEGLVAVPALLSNEELAWGIRRDDSELLEQANSFLKEFEASGELQKIVTRWLPQAK